MPRAAASIAYTLRPYTLSPDLRIRKFTTSGVAEGGSGDGGGTYPSAGGVVAI